MMKLLTLSFWFQNPPLAMSSAFNGGFLLFFALLAIGGALLSMLSKRSLKDAYDKQAFRMSAAMMGWLSFLGFVWLFNSFEEVQIFGVRAWFLLWVLVAIACIIRVVKFVKKDAPKLRETNASRSAVNAYLPRRAR